jgi:hypothetical protein
MRSGTISIRLLRPLNIKPTRLADAVLPARNRLAIDDARAGAQGQARVKAGQVLVRAP